MKYELKKRAESQAQTRLRITEATLGLHGEIGPARTTISAIADRAGVQRHTVYRHFPDERSLMMACSGLHMERNPPPTPTDIAPAGPGEPRLRRGLELLYAWYERNAGILGHVVRDAEVHEMTREAVAARFSPALQAYRDAIATDWPARGSRRERVLAALTVALDFRTWQTLHASGLPARDAVATAVAMVRGQ